MRLSSSQHDFAAELGTLGYPGFAYGKGVSARKPEQVLLDALNSSDLDVRVAEGLPWLVLTYVDMDWDRLIRDGKSLERQNRLGFAVSLANESARNAHDDRRECRLRRHLETLERRAWRSRFTTAAHWNRLTDIGLEGLSYFR
jgi:hypothetical protein